MRTIILSLLVSASISSLVAQEADSLKARSTYKQAWDAAMLDGKVIQEERVLLDILLESMLSSIDSSKTWESQWASKIPHSIDQAGRWPLVLQNMIIGAGIYGWGIPYVLYAQDERWMVGGEMISIGGAFYLTYQYTKGREISHAGTQMMRYGSLLGLRYGFAINELFNLDGGDFNRDRKTLWAWILMSSVPAGHFGGEYLFEKVNPTNGQAWAWTLWTGATALSARMVYGVFENGPEPPAFYIPSQSNSEEWDLYEAEKAEWEKRKTLAELIGYPLGIYAGYALTKDRDYSFGDALMLIQGWGYGYINTMMMQAILSDAEEDELFLMLNSFGAIAGALSYDHWIRNDDFSFGEATLMLLGSASGTAFGFGTAALLDVKEKEATLSLAILGYGGGTYLTRQILDVKANGRLKSSSENHITLSPTVLPEWSTKNGLKLLPALSLQISMR